MEYDEIRFDNKNRPCIITKRKLSHLFASISFLYVLIVNETIDDVSKKLANNTHETFVHSNHEIATK